MTPAQKDRFREHILTILRESFFQRKEEQENYSIRAFARELEIDPTFLSRLLAGKKPLTFKTALRLANKLGLQSEKLLHNLGRDRNITDQIFSPISRWYFFALLEIQKLTSFKKNKYWIASKIGIEPEELESALKILQDNGHLDTQDNNWDVILDESRWDGTKEPSERKRNFQKQIIRKAHSAIDDFTPEEREAFSLAIAASSNVLPIIKDKIRNLSEEIAEICETSKDKDDVYQLHCSFFPITQKTGEI